MSNSTDPDESRGVTRRGLLGVLASGGLALPVAGCSFLFPKRYRFRMTVEVETPDGLKTGSSVMEISAYKALKILPEEHAGGGDFLGEAVTVDLPDGPIFVLREICGGCQPLSAMVTLAFLPETRRGHVDSHVAAVGKLGGWFADYKAELPRKDWPRMVRFRDLSDPTSVELVRPETIGVKRIRLETTSDELTTGIDKRLPWLNDRGSLLDSHSGLTIHPTLAQTISRDEFWRRSKR
ncbi:hypothetical protein [Rhodopseudomonas faecalis]|uniref:hypothetical protein n=1 Tax=Rhodopseudomonas faecalis TaxID=99655 RepID=UPI0011B6AC09|nr:hypothetical protein [Rhodopseudomonas faecalis]